MSIEQVEAAYQQREVCVPAHAAARILFRPLHHDLAQVQKRTENGTLLVRVA